MTARFTRNYEMKFSPSREKIKNEYDKKKNQNYLETLMIHCSLGLDFQIITLVASSLKCHCRITIIQNSSPQNVNDVKAEKIFLQIFVWEQDSTSTLSWRRFTIQLFVLKRWRGKKSKCTAVTDSCVRADSAAQIWNILVDDWSVNCWQSYKNLKTK